MSLLDRAKKLEKLIVSNRTVKVDWVVDMKDLSVAQIDSATDIYIYLEI